MKALIEGFKREARLPYAIVLTQFIGAAIYFLVIKFGDSAASALAIIEGTGVWWLWLLGSFAFLLIISLVSLLLIVRAIKFDRALSRIIRDEREMHNDYIVANTGYTISVYGLILMIFFTNESITYFGYEIILTILLTTILSARMYKRFIIEKEASSD